MSVLDRNEHQINIGNSCQIYLPASKRLHGRRGIVEGFSSASGQDTQSVRLKLDWDTVHVLSNCLVVERRMERPRKAAKEVPASRSHADAYIPSTAVSDALLSSLRRDR